MAKRSPKSDTPPAVETPKLEIVYKPLAWFLHYERNPRKNDKAVGRMVDSIKEFGFAVPCLAKSSGELIDGHLRLKAAVVMKLPEVPVILCDGWSDAQVKVFRLLVNRSVAWADWDLDALALEFADLKALDFDLSLTGFDPIEFGDLSGVEQPEFDENAAADVKYIDCPSCGHHFPV
jgi:hypothetical protein